VQSFPWLPRQGTFLIELRGVSPTYERLCLAVADDADASHLEGRAEIVRLPRVDAGLDLELGREVAIKVLRPELAAAPSISATRTISTVAAGTGRRGEHPSAKSANAVAPISAPVTLIPFTPEKMVSYESAWVALWSSETPIKTTFPERSPIAVSARSGDPEKRLAYGRVRMVPAGPRRFRYRLFSPV
jgi:hypothetical protein